MNCPNCQATFDKGRLHGIPIRRCRECEGLLLIQKHLLNILESIAPSIMPSISMDSKIDPLPSGDQIRVCPTCDEQMEAFGYLGTKIVVIDSCSKCKHLFLDKLELGVMAALYVKTNKITELRRTSRASFQNDLLSSHVYTQAVNQAFMMGFLLG
jgi:Zn-finger nucleic acid-binding protein